MSTDSARTFSTFWPLDTKQRFPYKPAQPSLILPSKIENLEIDVIYPSCVTHALTTGGGLEQTMYTQYKHDTSKRLVVAHVEHQLAGRQLFYFSPLGRRTAWRSRRTTVRAGERGGCLGWHMVKAPKAYPFGPSFHQIGWLVPSYINVP